MDLRKPIGLLFTLLGLILTGFAFATGDAHLTKAGDNLNLWWGAVMLVFGVVMLAFALRAEKCAAKEKSGDCGSGCGCGKK